jgi:hypothetical protein
LHEYPVASRYEDLPAALQEHERANRIAHDRAGTLWVRRHSDHRLHQEALVDDLVLEDRNAQQVLIGDA